MEDRLLLGSWLGEVSSTAPPPFMVAGNPAVPVDAASLDLVVEADAAQERATGRGGSGSPWRSQAVHSWTWCRARHGWS